MPTTLRPNINVSPFAAGLVLGLGAALIQAFFNVVPPAAYGFCMICHPSDLVNWAATYFLHTHWSKAFSSAPALTAIGVMFGALLAGLQHKELRWRRVRQPVLYFLAGVLTVKFGFFLGGCPIRVLLLTAYGSLMGLVGAACVAIGVALGAVTLRWHARRAAARMAMDRRVVA